MSEMAGPSSGMGSPPRHLNLREGVVAPQPQSSGSMVVSEDKYETGSMRERERVRERERGEDDRRDDH